MVATAERTFFTSLLALEADAPAAETITVALRALVVLTRARHGSAEIRMHGKPRPMALASASADPSSPPGRGVLGDVFETGFASARLELRTRRTEPTFRERWLFGLMFQSMTHLTARAPVGVDAAVARNLHQATRAFQAKLVANALQRARGNVARAARELHVTRGFIYKFMRAAGTRRA